MTITLDSDTVETLVTLLAHRIALLDMLDDMGREERNRLLNEKRKLTTDNEELHTIINVMTKGMETNENHPTGT